MAVVSFFPCGVLNYYDGLITDIIARQRTSKCGRFCSEYVENDDRWVSKGFCSNGSNVFQCAPCYCIRLTIVLKNIHRVLAENPRQPLNKNESGKIICLEKYCKCKEYHIKWYKTARVISTSGSTIRFCEARTFRETFERIRWKYESENTYYNSPYNILCYKMNTLQPLVCWRVQILDLIYFLCLVRAWIFILKLYATFLFEKLKDKRLWVEHL